MNDASREVLLQHLAVDEGCVLHAYQDSLGYTTIGFGRLIDHRRGGGITHAEAIYLLENDVRRHWYALVARLPWVVELDEVRQVAVANLAFNLGVDGLLKFTNTLAAMQRQDWLSAASGLRNSRWYTQVGKARSGRIIDMIITGHLP